MSYSDDAKRIPARYRGAAEMIQSDGLTGYKRYSPDEACRSGGLRGAARGSRRAAARAESRARGEAAPVYVGRARRSRGQGGPDTYVRVGETSRSACRRTAVTTRP